MPSRRRESLWRWVDVGVMVLLCGGVALLLALFQDQVRLVVAGLSHQARLLAIYIITGIGDIGPVSVPEIHGGALAGGVAVAATALAYLAERFRPKRRNRAGQTQTQPTDSDSEQ